MTTIMMKVSMCEFYAGIYEGATHSISSSDGFHRALFSALPEFHASVIVFSIKTREYFQARCKLSILMKTSPGTPDDKQLPRPGVTKILNALKPFDVEFGPFIAEIDSRERVIRECADGATMVRIKSRFISLSFISDCFVLFYFFLKEFQNNQSSAAP